MDRQFWGLHPKLRMDGRAQIERKLIGSLKQLSLPEVRRSRAVSQMTVAFRLGVQQSAVAKLEKRADLRVSSLREFVEALGGELALVAVFHDGAAKIVQGGSRMAPDDHG